MPSFIPGLKLSECFFQEVVQPLFEANFAELPYSAALIGAGSEVLGFDDEMSSDHDWGPRVLLFLRPEDKEALGGAIQDVLGRKLPSEFKGYPTTFENRRIKAVQLRTLGDLLTGYAKFDVDRAIEPADWLAFPQHSLRELTSGVVFRDDIGLQSVRDRFAYYPRDIWLYLMMASWARIAEEEHLMGRAGFVNDELGSAIMGSRLIREVMRLGFFLEKQYAPYPKWFGTAFAGLSCGKDLAPVLLRAQLAATWREREAHLCAALEHLVALHNALAVTEPVSPQASQFANRPFQVIDADRLVHALAASISDNDVKRIAQDQRFGGIDHISDNPNFLMHGAALRKKLCDLYR